MSARTRWARRRRARLLQSSRVTVPRASNHRIDAPRTRTGEHEVQEDEAVEYGGRAHVRRWPKRPRIMALKVGHCHFPGEHKRHRACEQAYDDQQASD